VILRRIINKRFRTKSHDVNVAGGINAVVSANSGSGKRSHVASSQRTRIVQRGGETEVFEDTGATSRTEEGK
jgi:hypothetical protein